MNSATNLLPAAAGVILILSVFYTERACAASTFRTSAKLTGTPHNYKYIQEVPANVFSLGYSRIASRTDFDYLTCFSLEELNLPAGKK